MTSVIFFICVVPLLVLVLTPLGVRSATNWMSDLEDSTPLNTLNIPGTCSSAANTPFPGVTVHQFDDITNQLIAGIRFFDLHFGWLTSGEITGLICSQGLIQLPGPVTSYDVFNPMVNFLGSNPNEVIFASITMETPLENKNLFYITLDSFYGEVHYNPFWYTGKTLNDLGSARGKIILLKSEDISDWTNGFDLNTGFDVEDHVNVSVSTKTTYVLDHLATAQKQISVDIFITNTDTGINSNQTEIVSQTLNSAVSEYIAQNPSSYFGILVLDFPSTELIDAIIASNEQHSIVTSTSNITYIHGRTLYHPPIARWVVGLICGGLGSIILIIALVLIYRDSLQESASSDDAKYDKLSDN